MQQQPQQPQQPQHQPPNVLGPDGKPLPLRPINLNAKGNIPYRALINNMRYALSLGYPMFYKRAAHNGEGVLVGTGPSVANCVEEIRELYKKGCAVAAVKGAHDYLMERNILPHIGIAVDGQEKIADLYRKPDPAITYLIASQCHRKTFDALQGQKVVIWNCFTKKAMSYWNKYNARKKNKRRKIFFVNGGSTSGLRGIALLWLMGFRRLNLFGYDSCLGQDNQLLKITGEQNEKDTLVAAVDDRHFMCDPAMAVQGNEFLPQLKAMPGLQVKVWGDGFIPYAAHCQMLRDDPQCVHPHESWYELDHPERGTRKDNQVVHPHEAPVWV